eukprot:4127607-Prorocentrum_lima.AAC.1
MTSSLVGSEMCIRDSSYVRSIAARKLNSVPYSPGNVCSHHPPSPAAVSYTHLTLPTICSV